MAVRLLTTFVFYVLTISASSQYADINDYLEQWYLDQDHPYKILREGEKDTSDMTRKCPRQIYFTNRLLCYTYWRNIDTSDSTFWGKIPNSMQRGMLETLEIQRRYGGTNSKKAILSPSISNTASRGDIQKQDSRGLPRTNRRNNNNIRNNKAILFHG